MSLEYCYFAFVIIFAFFIEQILIYRRHQRLQKAFGKGAEEAGSYFLYGLTVFMTAILIITLWGGGWIIKKQEMNEKQKLRAAFDGIAPILVYDLQMLGHAAVTPDAPGDDPRHRALIATMVQWMKINPQIKSIYTVRKMPDGTAVFVLGPEPGYDKNGIINGEDETRVSAATACPVIYPEMEQAFNGQYAFREEIAVDQVGSCVNAFMPIYGDDKNKPEAVLAMDFDGEVWDAAISKARLRAMVLIWCAFILLNVCYHIICFSWIERTHIKQQKISEETARLDRLNLIGEMAASIGHEVRNPLTTVRGYLQLLRKEETEFRRIEKFNVAIEELDRANAIITKFLFLAKNKAVELRMMSINLVINKILPLVQAEAALTGNEIVLNLGEVPEMPLDEKEICKMILNLVRNSLEAMSGQGVVTINTFYDKGAAVLEVRDTGKGIPAAVMKSLGTPFVTTKADGYGLGLAVCFKVAERHGATVDVQTGANGTAFIIRFAHKLRLVQKR